MSELATVELTQEQKNTFFQSLHTLYIQPELDKRFGSNGLPEGFQIREYLIMFPVGQPPVVKFNDEFGWLVDDPALSDGRKIQELDINQPIHLYDILKFSTVLAPKIDDKHVFFVYGHWNGFGWSVFVGSPDDPAKNAYIARHLQLVLIERVVAWAKRHISQIQQIGLWIVTSLLPYPLSKIVERVDTGNLDEARQVLIDFCDGNFIAQKLVGTWHPIKVFRDRELAFEEALTVHQSGFYHASISILINHIEGVIVDWLHEILPASDVTWKTKSRMEQFRTVLQPIPQFEYAYSQALESTIEFLQEGENTAKPFQAFKNWLDKIDPNFPARHVISHGKYVPELYTQENSIKLFLLLDTLCQFMMFYEIRVLGHDLGQNSVEAG
jgi:hypothetical protein